MRPKGYDERMKSLEALLNDGRPRSLLEVAAVQRQMADLESGHKRGLCWDEKQAANAVSFFRHLQHWKGEWYGRPIRLEPWQEHCLIAPLFGWYRLATRDKGGIRRFRQGYVEIPRKNGKTTALSGVGNYALIADGEPGAEVYAAATKRDQANILFKDAQKTLGKGLRERLKLMKNSLLYDRLGSSFQPLSSDYNSLDGLNIHCAIIDELHAHKTRDLYDVLLTACGSRRSPLLLAITTAGYDRSSICWEQRELVRRILEGHEDNDAYFGFIATTDPDDDWRDPQTWWKANPNLHVSLREDYLADLCASATSFPGAENNFRRKHLNQWTEQSVRWLPMDAWDASAGEEIDEAELVGRPCYVGLDLASTRDLTAMVGVFPDEGGYDVLAKFWAPKESASRRDAQDRQSYMGWVPEWITLTEGNSTDQQTIRQELWEWSERFDVRCVGADPWNMDEFFQQMVREGWPEDKWESYRQGFASYNEPMKKCLELVRDKKLRHGGNPVLRWNAANVVAKEDPSGNLRPDKGKSQDKIDGFCALLMGLGLALQMAGEEDVLSEVGIYVIGGDDDEPD